MSKFFKQYLFSLIFLSFIFNVHAQVKIKTMKYTYNRRACTKDCDIEFPIIIYKDSSVANTINSNLAACFGDEDSSGNILKSVFDLDSKGGWFGTTELHYKINSNSARLLSISFDSEYIGAYPNYISTYKNFDLANGKTIDIIQLLSIKYFIELAEKLRTEKQKAVSKNIKSLTTDTDKVMLESLKENDEQWLTNNEPSSFYLHNNILYLADEPKNFYPHIFLPVLPHLMPLRIDSVSFIKYLTPYGKYIFGFSSVKSTPATKFQFRGKIDDKYDIKLVFIKKTKNSQQKIDGYYFYTNKSGILLYATGTLNGQQIHLDIMNSKNIITEQFDGTLSEQHDINDTESRLLKTFTGKWINLKSKQKYSFNLQESDY